MLEGWTILLIASAYLGVLFAIAYCRRPPRRPGPQHHQQPLHLHALDRGLLHRLDLLRQRRPRRRERPRLPADLPRPDADGLPVVVRAAQDAAHHQGLRHHHDRRLRRLALRQERAPRRPRHAGRGGRHHALHLAPAEGRLDQRRGDPRLPGRRRRSGPISRCSWRLLLAAFSILFGTRHIDATEHHQGMVAAIAFEFDRQADRLRRGRQLRHLRACSTASATSSPRRSPPASASS